MHANIWRLCTVSGIVSDSRDVRILLPFGRVVQILGMPAFPTPQGNPGFHPERTHVVDSPTSAGRVSAVSTAEASVAVSFFSSVSAGLSTISSIFVLSVVSIDSGRSGFLKSCTNLKLAEVAVIQVLSISQNINKFKV